MKSPLKSLTTTHPTPLVTAFSLVTAVLAAILIYQAFSPFKVIDFGPAVKWLTIAVPAGFFASVFLQIRANQRTHQTAEQVHARIAELEAEAINVRNPRAASQTHLDRPFPDKDPFENL